MRKSNNQIVREFLKKNPPMPKQTAAKQLREKHPDRFSSVEKARDVVRLITGSKKGSTGGFKGDPIDYPKVRHPFTIKSLAKDIDFYKLPINYGKGVILSDIHLMYHCEKSLYASLEYAKQKNVDFIYLNGDIMDCYAISRFPKRQEKAHYIYEVQTFLEFVDMLKNEFPKAKIFFKIGNHEKRVQDYLSVNAPAIFDWSVFSWKKFTNLGLFDIDPQTNYPIFEKDEDDEPVIPTVDRGIKVIPENVITKIGDGVDALYLLHGHEIKMSSPVNSAKALFNKGMCNAIVGHFHQSSEHSQRMLDRRLVTTWSLGCLAHLQQEYDPYNIKWMNGFGVLEVDGDSWRFVNKKIINGKVM